MRHRLHPLATPAILMVLTVTAACARSGPFIPPEDPMVGRPAPPFVFHGVQKHRRSFPVSNFAGKTLVLIFIRPGQPELQTLLHEMDRMRWEPAFADAQFMVMASEEDPIIEPFWIGLQNPLPFALDFTDAAGRYGAGTLPMVVIRDFRGIVRLRLDGYVGKEFLPRLEATKRILKQVEQARSRPADSSR